MQKWIAQPGQEKHMDETVIAKKDGMTLMQLHDGTVVIVGDYLTAEEAEKNFGKEYRKKFKRDAKDRIAWAGRGWIRLELIGVKRSKEECDGMKPWKSLWFLHEGKRKPAGEIVKEVTVL